VVDDGRRDGDLDRRSEVEAVAVAVDRVDGAAEGQPADPGERDVDVQGGDDDEGQPRAQAAEDGEQR
jgi:hypothetical protein